MKGSNLLALGIFAVVAIWMMTGDIRSTLSDTDNSASETAVAEYSSVAADSETQGSHVSVQVETMIAENIDRRLVLQGQVLPYRKATLRAEATGRVVELPGRRGERVSADQLLLKLSADDRTVRLLQAKAVLRQRKSDLSAHETLMAKGLKAKNHVIQSKAQLAIAEAELEQVRIELKNTRILAPFAGILEQRKLEIGDFVDRADPVATIVDDSQVLLVAQVSQRNLGCLQLGQQVSAELISGKKLNGRLSYIATVADDETRSYRIEVEVPNPEGERWIGLSVSLDISVEQLKAHRLSAALLSLNSDGGLAIKTLSSDRKVLTTPVSIVRSETDGVWVTGLPDKVRVITRGQGFYQPGDSLPVSSVMNSPMVLTSTGDQ
ncbi:efflux RND transporter periplasmic adaptor subunit [Amphritea japonica]|uniref:RND family efflux transporter MFP subunit n=1 Tax=Amphritea japonica ATCC BAA-1530 TaxID=1278309 RepID=A0A7R6SSR4_9GAMM|nr:efflux RND transporter periplasmic adaptor subunit [Amphritea japonica]BBB25905.1 RND family efflux transporter MFP subunit [Amphritea japonica ATCC BAA-1530]